VSPHVTPWSPTLAEFLSAPIRIRPEARATRVDGLHVAARVRTALIGAGLRRVGDLHGRRGADLNWLPGVGSPQLRDLHRALVARGALQPRRTDWSLPGLTAPPRTRRSTPSAPRRPRQPQTLSSETEFAAAGPFLVARILIRPDKRDVAFAQLPLSNWLEGTLRYNHIRRFGDLDGRDVRDLRKLRRLGRVQLCELHGALVAHDALEREAVAVVPGAAALRGLHALLPQPRVRVLLEHAPPFWRIRSETIVIRPQARAMPLEELPLTWPLHKAVVRRGRRTLGDLSGLTYDAVAGRPSRRSVVRQIYSLLHLAEVCVPQPALPTVPARLRDVRVEDVDMSRPLRDTLRRLRVQRLGQLSAVGPAQLASAFDGNSGTAFVALLEKLQALHLDDGAPARAIDRALATLPPKERRGIVLRFGGRGRPLTVRGVLRELGLPLGLEDARHDRRWIVHLRAALGPALRRRLRELAAGTSKRAVMTAEEVDRRLGLRKSKARHPWEFYVRLMKALEPRLRVKVRWEKKGYGLRLRGERGSRR
jgi:hypothetical protein